MQLTLFPEELIQDIKSTTFIDNMSLPIHRWFRYSAGFSSEWVRKVILSKNIRNKENYAVLDPFAGSGTTLISCEQEGVKSYGYEAQPFIYRVAQAKLCYKNNIEEFTSKALNILSAAKHDNSFLDTYPELVHKCYSKENLIKLDRIKRALFNDADDSDSYKLCWLAFVSILRSTSSAGTAQWQYILPNKSKAKIKDVYEAFEEKLKLMSCDMSFAQKSFISNDPVLFSHDSRNKSSLPDNSIDLVITSPPYANNYDYGDATRLEMSILGEVVAYSDLQTKVRSNLIRSCSQMVSQDRAQTYNFISDPILAPIADELEAACRSMEIERQNHAGKKNYHTMVALYFHDLARVWIDLRRVCKPNSEICFVIGDSAPYGIHIPTDEWLGRLAINAGFASYEFEKTRDRNTKWKNRKHRIPLKEGRLWIKG